MKDYVTGGRLILFSEEEKLMIKGTYDFLSLNHYTSNYVHYTGKDGHDYTSDSRLMYAT